MRSRLKAAACFVGTVATVVAVTLVNGCGAKSVVSPDPTQEPEPEATQAAPQPTQAPAPQPTSVQPLFTGSWGPGTFTGSADTCNPAFFNPSYSGSILVVNDTTFLSLFEGNSRRDSTCTFSSSSRLANCAGSGSIAGNPATWNTTVQFSTGTVPSAVVTETVRLTQRSNCGRTYTSGSLPRV